MTTTLRRLAPLLAPLLLLACGGSGASGTDATLSDHAQIDALGDGAAPDPDGVAKPDGGPDAIPDAHVDAPADALSDRGPADAPAEADAQPPDADETAPVEVSSDAKPEATSPDTSVPSDASDADTPPTDAAPETVPDAIVDPGADTSAPPAPLFDLGAIRDPSTAACTFTNHRTAIKNATILDLWDVSYQSWQAVDGTLQPITIRGFLARPLGSGTLPGLVQAHGLGGCADEDNATGPASLLGMVTLAYTGPGGGAGVEGCAVSEGTPAGADSGMALFDVLPDARASWFWGHPVAAMRGITCLQQRTDVDPDRIGMTGFSAGGVATLVVAGADDRLKAGVPLSACGRWDMAVQSPDAWQHGLLQMAGLTTASPEWTGLLSVLDPALVASAGKTPLLLVDGTSDEFFPLSALVPTLAGLTGAETRLSLVGNFDHGCYALSGVEDAGTIESRATLHAEGAQRLWLRHWLTTDPRFAYVPATPVLQVQPQAGGILATALVDAGGSSLDVESVTLWWSLDDAFLWGHNDLQEDGGVWWALLPIAPAANLVTFVDVQYKTAGLPVARFTLSSVPALPTGFVPHIRAQTTCL